MENIKMLSYRFLLEAQFKELNIPIEQLEAVLEKQDIILVAYSAAESIQGAMPADVWPEVLEGMRQNDGISVVCDDFTAILYSDDLCYGKKLHTIYHELGHIKAKHKRSGKVRFAENEEQEREAEAFAYYTVAPPCILHEIGGMSDCVFAHLLPRCPERRYENATSGHTIHPVPATPHAFHWYEFFPPLPQRSGRCL